MSSIVLGDGNLFIAIRGGNRTKDAGAEMEHLCWYGARTHPGHDEGDKNT